MTINIAPAASGVNTLPLSTATPTTKVRKNAPIDSTAYFRVATPHWGAAATATDFGSLVMTFAICFLLEFAAMYSTIPRTPSRRHHGQRPFIPPANRTHRIPASCNYPGDPAFTQAEADSRPLLTRRRKIVNTCAGCLRRNGLNSSRCLNRLTRAQPPAVAPLVLSGAAPDASIAAVQRPPQAGRAHRARSAYLLGFVDLRQGGT